MKKLFMLVLVISLNSNNYGFDGLKSNNVKPLIYEIVKTEREINIEKIRLIIRFKESSNRYDVKGKLNEIGAYQFMPYMWRILSDRYFGKRVEPTMENQDIIAIRYITELYDLGYSYSEIASIWNCGKSKPNNKKTVGYVQHFNKLYKSN